MPLTQKGDEILHAMQKEYGAKKGESVFYASRNAGTIAGVDAAPRATLHDSIDRYMDAARRGDEASLLEQRNQMLGDRK